jgi:hypothetical protein
MKLKNIFLITSSAIFLSIVGCISKSVGPADRIPAQQDQSTKGTGDIDSSAILYKINDEKLLQFVSSSPFLFANKILLPPFAADVYPVIDSDGAMDVVDVSTDNKKYLIYTSTPSNETLFKLGKMAEDYFHSKNIKKVKLIGKLLKCLLKNGMKNDLAFDQFYKIVRMTQNWLIWGLPGESDRNVIQRQLFEEYRGIHRSFEDMDIPMIEVVFRSYPEYGGVDEDIISIIEKLDREKIIQVAKIFDKVVAEKDYKNHKLWPRFLLNETTVRNSLYIRNQKCLELFLYFYPHPELLKYMTAPDEVVDRIVPIYKFKNLYLKK